MLSLLLLASAALGAPCPATTAELEEQARAGVLAFEELDASGFDLAVEQVRLMAGCPDAAVDSVVVAQLHLLMALDAYMAQDNERARAAFRAVLAADPGFQPAATLAPKGNPLRDLFEQARRDPEQPGAELALPSEGDFWVDGLPAGSRPTDRPFVLQWIGAEGDVRWSAYLPMGAHLPIEVLAAMHEKDSMEVFSVAPPPPRVREPAVASASSGDRRGPGVPLLVSAGGVAAVSGGLLAASLAARGQWRAAVEECVTWDGCADDPQGALTDHAALAERARLLGFAAQGGAGLALGLGLVGGVTLVW
jgi:hypothetical protein